MYLGREKDLRKKPLKDAEKKAGLGNPGEGSCLIHCLWLLRWPKGSVTEHMHWTQFLCLGFDFLCPKIVGELWVRMDLQQRAVFTLAWGLDWLACLQTAPIKDSLRSLMTATISILNKPTKILSLALYEAPFSFLIIISLDTPLLVYAAKERKGWAHAKALGPLQKFSNWLFLLWPCHHQSTARAQLLPVVWFCDTSSMLQSNQKPLAASNLRFLQKWPNKAGQEIHLLFHHYQAALNFYHENFCFLNWKGTPLMWKYWQCSAQTMLVQCIKLH